VYGYVGAQCANSEAASGQALPVATKCSAHDTNATCAAAADCEITKAGPDTASSVWGGAS